MVFNVNEKYNLLVLKSMTKDECFSLEKHFNRVIDGWQFKKKYAGNWNGVVEFFKDYKYIPLGLRDEVKKMCKKYDYPLAIHGEDRITNNSITLEWFTKIVNQFFVNHEPKPRSYQIEAAYEILKNRYCLGELATSAGKTLILFLTILYHRAKNPNKKILVVVPNVDLVDQTIDELLSYDPQERLKMQIQPVYSGSKQIEMSNIVIGTYQSLVKKDKDFYAPFNVCIVDETHKATAKSIRDILKNCLHCEYRYGVSGTIQKEETTDRWNVMAYTGPIIKQVKAKFLMDEGFITKCKITVFNLQYKDVEMRKNLYTLSKSDEISGSEMYNLERKYVSKSEGRMKLLVDLCKKSNKNVLILFRFREYGEEAYNTLKKELANYNKKVYYIDGGVSTDNRSIFKDDAENEDNVILVASYGTFSTGINVKNLHYLILFESVKDEKILRQSIGRLLRKHASKEMAHIVDFRDDLSVVRRSGSKWKNILLRQGEARTEIYKSEQFEFKVRNVQI